MNPARSGPRFNVRAFVSVAMIAAGIGLPWTGLANHVLQAEPMTVWRHAWMAAHNNLGVLFAVFTAWHVALNRRAVWNYLRGAVARAPAARVEALTAVFIVTFVTALLVSHAFHVHPR